MQPHTALLWNFLCLLAATTIVVATVASSDNNDNNTLHVLVYETDERLAKENSLARLQENNIIPGLDIQIVGIGQTFAGFGSKYQSVLPALLKLPESAIAVISDGRDVLLNHNVAQPKESSDNHNNNDDAPASSSIRSFLQTFRDLVGERQSIVVSAEAQCCVSALTYAAPGDYFAPDGSRAQRACFSGHSDCMWNGDEKALPWENFMKSLALDHGATSNGREDIYLNAGLMTGRVRDLIRVITNADIGDREDDQAVLTGYMYQNPTDILLDYNQALFGNNRDTCMFDLHHNHQLVHKQTATSPLFIHTPGGKATCHEQLLAELGQNTVLSKTVRRRLYQWNTATHNYKTCPTGYKLVSGYCVRDFCQTDYACPRNSVRKPGRECYNNNEDCQCKAGYYMHVKGYCQLMYLW